MNDTVHPGAKKAVAALRDVHPHVYEGVEIGIDRARDFFSGSPHDPWLFSHIVRHEAANFLEARVLVGGFRLKRNPMSGIEIVSGSYCCRLWRIHSDPAHLLQPPGESERRQDFYLQKQPDLPGTEHLRPTWSNLVYVWDSSSAGVAIHLVCPYGFDGIWKPGDHLWQVAIDHPASKMKPTPDLAQRDDDDLPLYLDETGDEPEPTS